MKKTIFTKHVVDQDGVLTGATWINKQAYSPDHFVKMYLDDLAIMNTLTHAEHKILVHLAKFLEYNTNSFFMNRQRRQQLAKEAGITENTFNQSLSRLMKKNLIIKESSSMYQMNPNVFFNGEELKRMKFVELKVKYELCYKC